MTRFIRRREFVGGLGASSVWPAVAGGQALPIIGVIHPGSPDAVANRNRMAVFRNGILEGGLVEGKDVAIEYRWGRNQTSNLAELVRDLIGRRVAVITALSTVPAAMLAKQMTSSIPIIFEAGFDPVEAGLVTSLNRPGGNVTGITSMNVELASKQLGIVHELLPIARHFAVLINPDNPNGAAFSKNAQAAAATIGVELKIIPANSGVALDEAFPSLIQKGVEVLIFSPDPFFNERRTQIVTLAAHYSLPAMYWQREFPEAGGLLSYGSSVTELYRLAGAYSARIVNGEKPADLPVMRPTKFEFLINLQAARTLRLNVPPTLLALADEVIE